MFINRFTSDLVKTPNGNSVLAIGSIYSGEVVDFIVYKDITDNQVNLALKIGPEDEDFITGPFPEKFQFSNGYKATATIMDAPKGSPEDCLKGYWAIIFNVPFGLEEIINEAILACGYWRGYKEGEKK